MPLEQLTSLPKRDILLLNFLDLIRGHMRLSQFTSYAYGTDLSPNSFFILEEIYYQADIGLDSLAQSLGIDKSNVSRTIKKLVERKLLTEEASKIDKRKRKYHLTGIGNKYLKIHQDFNYQQIADQLKNVKAAEGKELKNFLKGLCDRLDIKGIPRKGKDLKTQIWQQISRITLGFKLGSDIFNTTYSAEEWLYLSEILYKSSSTAEIADLLNVPYKTASMKINKFIRQGLLDVVPDLHDKRSNNLFVTNQGLKCLKVIDQAGLELVRTGLQNLSDSKLSTLNDLLWRYIHSSLPYRAVLSGTLAFVKSNNSTEDLLIAKRFLVKNIASQADSYQFSDSFFAEDNEIIFIHDQKKLVGVYEGLFNAQEFSLKNYFLNPAYKLGKKNLAEINQKLFAVNNLKVAGLQQY